jgi:cytochrome c oxidase cbb3-type subunit 3
MPPMGAALGSDKDVENVAHYVLSLSGSTTTRSRPCWASSAPAWPATAPSGRATRMLGAPNLTDKIWLYGGSADTIMETIRKGRNNTMPAFSDFLGESKVHVLAAYVWSFLSNPQTPVK